ncbi:hypothetical protein C8F01DRAFT_1100755 [Mycena amicta]|nr:hypothetical protein C8F01DRAFT_1100755 [Mycena amicta]
MTDPGSRFMISKRAASQGRNMHVFSFDSFPAVRVAGGFNLDRSPLTAKTFYRWLDLCDLSLNPFHTSVNVVLRRIKLVAIDVLSYAMESVDGPSIPRDSVELLEPGVYGIFLPDGEPYKGIIGSDTHHYYPFPVQQAKLVANSCGKVGSEIGDSLFQDQEDDIARLIEQNKIPQALAELAVARDQGKCWVTGRTDLQTQLVWVYPPLASFSLDEHDPECWDKHRVLDNIVTICAALAEPFNGNVFTVDLDDNGRIITFDDLPSESPQLPPCLTVLPLSPSSEHFWRLNFKYTLLIYFPAGDASRDYARYNPSEWMRELMENEADLDDEKWHTGYGREVLEVFTRQLLSVKEYERRHQRPYWAGSDDSDAESAEGHY